MKKISLAFFLLGILAGGCNGGLRESLEERFSTLTAEEDGLLIVLKKRRISDRVSVQSDGIASNGDGPKMKSNHELGEYFIPYGFEWPVRIGQRDTAVRFYPLDSDDHRKGFFVREQDLLRGGRKIVTGTLLYVNDLQPTGNSYQIANEVKYDITYHHGGTKTTNIYRSAYAEQSNQQHSTSEEPSSVKQKPDRPAVAGSAQANEHVRKESGRQTVDENSTIKPLRLIFLIIGVLLTGMLALLKQRNRS
jgi:hypothetical protein